MFDRAYPWSFTRYRHFRRLLEQCKVFRAGTLELKEVVVMSAQSPAVTIWLTEHARDALDELGRYFDGSEDRVVEVAINRLHIQLFHRKEGDLVDVDFGQSLPEEPEGQVVSVRDLSCCD
jgi:hypothetical protein